MSKGVGEMVRSRSVQVKASAGTEGARRATRVPADGAAGEAHTRPLAPGQRWSVGRKRDVVPCCDATVAGSGRRDYRLDWRDRAMAGLERGLQARQGDLVAEALDAATRQSGSCRWRTSCCVSGTGAEQRRPLCGGRGDERHLRGHAPLRDPALCHVGALRRSTPGRHASQRQGEEPARRGPTPTVSDATLLEAIQPISTDSPFQGEGHRKVHARLRIGRDPGRADAGAANAGAQAALPAPRPPGHRAGASGRSSRRRRT